MHFQVSLKMGRTDTQIVEAKGKHELITFYNQVSKTRLASIKKVVYSKDLGISYVPKVPLKAPYFSKLELLVSSKSYSKTLVIRNVRKDYNTKELVKDIKQLTINGEFIKTVACINEYL